jgi:hypothetical protein
MDSATQQKEPPFQATCPECKQTFVLSCHEYSYKGTIRVSSCLSAGVYSVEIHCPHCEHWLDVLTYD